MKCKAEIVNGSLSDLIEFLWLWRDRLQWIIDLIWGLEKVPSESQLHQWFYNILRSNGFRAHHCKQLYKYARAIVKSAKENKGKKPIVRNLSARLDKYDYSLDLKRRIITLKLHNNKTITLKLLHRSEYFEKFLNGWSNYELIVKYDNDSIWVCIYFKRRVDFYVPLSTLVIDVNLWKIAMLYVDEVYNCANLRFINTPFEKYLKFRWRAHLIQKKYEKSWRFSKNILAKVRYWFRRAKNVLSDRCWKLAKQIALFAKKNYALVVVEKLDDVVRGGKGWKLSGFCYRKFLHALKCKCEENGVPIIEVDPKDTSRLCPICGNVLDHINYRIVKCEKCGYIGHRDTVAVINLYKKLYGRIPPLPYLKFFHQDRVPGSHGMNPPKGDATPSPMWEGKNEGMKKI